MNVVLVTGGTGTLGRAVEAEALAQGHSVRILSRRDSPADREPGTWATGDLETGDGLADAVRGVDTIIHCATNPRGGDTAMTWRLVAAALGQKRPPHLIYISIVGVDHIPLGYYRQKLATEHVVEHSGPPFTVVRATQFHDLVFKLFSAQRRMPAVLAPSIRLQPIDVRDVAAHLVRHVAGGPAGRVSDIGGPDIFDAGELAHLTLAALDLRRPVWPLRLPSKTFTALRHGYNLVPGQPAGTRTYAEFLAERAAGRAAARRESPILPS